MQGIVEHTHPRLKMRTYKVRVYVCPPKYEIELGLAVPHYETVTIEGYTLADAKRRADIG